MRIFSRYSVNIPGYASLPKYLAEVGYEIKNDPADCNWQRATAAPEMFFVWSAQNPSSGFHDTMLELASHKKDWTGIYPIDRLSSKVNNGVGRPMLVDVGGGRGIDIENFRRAVPNIVPGSLVLKIRLIAWKASSYIRASH